MAAKASWSLLKRSIHGICVSIELFHLFRYLDEQMFRFNDRAGKYRDRFALTLERDWSPDHVQELDRLREEARA